MKWRENGNTMTLEIGAFTCHVEATKYEDELGELPVYIHVTAEICKDEKVVFEFQGEDNKDHIVKMAEIILPAIVESHRKEGKTSEFEQAIDEAVEVDETARLIKMTKMGFPELSKVQDLLNERAKRAHAVVWPKKGAAIGALQEQIEALNKEIRRLLDV